MQAYERQREEMEGSGMSSLMSDLGWYVSGKLRALFGDTADIFLRFAFSPTRYQRIIAGPDKAARLASRMQMKGITLSSRAASRAYFTVEGSAYTEAAKFAASGGYFTEQTASILRESSHAAHAAHASNFSSVRQRSTVSAGPSSLAAPEASEQEAEHREGSTACCQAEVGRWKEHVSMCAKSCTSSCSKCSSRTKASPGRGAQRACRVLCGRLMLFFNNRQYVHTFKAASEALRKFADDSPEVIRTKEIVFNALHLDQQLGQARAQKLQAALTQLLKSGPGTANVKIENLKAAAKLLGVDTESESDSEGENDGDFGGTAATKHGTEAQLNLSGNEKLRNLHVATPITSIDVVGPSAAAAASHGVGDGLGIVPPVRAPPAPTVANSSTNTTTYNPCQVSSAPSSDLAPDAGLELTAAHAGGAGRLVGVQFRKQETITGRHEVGT